MKYFLFVLLVSLFVSCSKKIKTSDNCVAATVTQSGMPCNQWGIRVNNASYPSNNIPSQFQQEGLTVCITYDLYEDMRACACCGGTWANVKTIKNFTR